jgi:hypothetical protein
MNTYGFKILHDGFDYYLCLLNIPKQSKVIANDCKYRTDKAYVCDIRKIRSCKSKCKVIHQCFYNNCLIKYQIDTYVEAELDISTNICASGIHYFPLTTMVDYVSNYFKHLPIDWDNVYGILFLWIMKIIYQKNNLKCEQKVIYDFVKKDV